MTEEAPGPQTPDLMELLLETDSLDGFLLSLAQRAAAHTPASDGCGITLERGGRPLTVASAGTSAARLDEKQYGQDDGPCLTALRTGREVSVPDMLTEQRWGGYPAYALASGTHSSLSLPIAAHSDTAGALNLYSAKEDAFADADLVMLRDLASQATGALALAQRTADAQEFAADLRTALVTRAVIDQAIGVIMGQRRCTADEACAVLRAASQNRNVKLHALCTELVTKIGGGPPSTDGPQPRP
ncbi:ANTAR domain-containing protein (plasmid) [Streptomyces sp. CA-294286]|uniref:ANTAR domain-containing protein n=1 Tax=Streptomyces sp. CA-294286 TaxID=3240070 RepID=UPI003D8DE0D3